MYSIGKFCFVTFQLMTEHTTLQFVFCIKSDVASPVFVFLHSCVNQCIESREVDLEGCLSLGRVGYR